MAIPTDQKAAGSSSEVQKNVFQCSIRQYWLDDYKWPTDWNVPYLLFTSASVAVFLAPVLDPHRQLSLSRSVQANAGTNVLSPSHLSRSHRVIRCAGRRRRRKCQDGRLLTAAVAAFRFALLFLQVRLVLGRYVGSFLHTCRVSP